MMRKPEIGIKVLETVAGRLSKVESLVQNLATNDVDSRMAYLLIDLSEKYGENIGGNISIKLPLSREEMANRWKKSWPIFPGRFLLSACFSCVWKLPAWSVKARAIDI